MRNDEAVYESLIKVFYSRGETSMQATMSMTLALLGRFLDRYFKVQTREKVAWSLIFAFQKHTAKRTEKKGCGLLPNIIGAEISATQHGVK